MRRLWGLALAFCLLCGCGDTTDEAMQQALDFRTALMAGQGCTFGADVTVNLGDSIYDFSMDCAYDTVNRQADLTITAPEELAGVAASVEGDTAQLEFEGVAVAISTEVGGNLSPLVLPKLVGDAFDHGFIQWATAQEDGFTVQYELEGEQEIWVQVIFDLENCPLAVEIYQGGYCVLVATVENFCIL